MSITSPVETVDEVARWIAEDRHHYICVTNTHGISESQKDGRLRDIHNRSGLTVPDGVPVLWCGRYAGASTMALVRGPALMPDISARAATEGWRCFLYGAAEGTADLAASRLLARFPGLQIVGTYAPPFRALTADEDREVVAMINEADPHIVWVGLSTPKQEIWMAEHVGRLKANALIGVGAAFDIQAGLAASPPSWIQGSGFEWLYRLAHEPRRLWRRYMYNVPAFLLGILRRRPIIIREGWPN